MINPVLNAIDMKLDALLGIIDQRIVPAQIFQRAAATCVPLFYRFNAVEGAMLPSTALETDSNRHVYFLQPYKSGNSGRGTEIRGKQASLQQSPHPGGRSEVTGEAQIHQQRWSEFWPIFGSSLAILLLFAT